MQSGGAKGEVYTYRRETDGELFHDEFAGLNAINLSETADLLLHRLFKLVQVFLLFLAIAAKRLEDGGCPLKDVLSVLV